MEPYQFQGTGLFKNEISWARTKFKNYQKHYHIDDYNLLHLLELLIVKLAELERLKKLITKDEKSGVVSEIIEQNGGVDWKVRKAIDEDTEVVVSLSEKLGLFKNKEKESLYNYIQGLKEKQQLYRRENPKSYSFPCPSCGKMIHAMVRVNNDTHIISEHPFFNNKFFDGGYLMELLETGKLTKEEVAKTIKVHVDYISHLMEKRNK